MRTIKVRCDEDLDGEFSGYGLHNMPEQEPKPRQESIRAAINARDSDNIQDGHKIPHGQFDMVQFQPFPHLVLPHACV